MAYDNDDEDADEDDVNADVVDDNFVCLLWAKWVRLLMFVLIR